MSLDWNSDISIRDQWAHQHAVRGVKEVWNKKLSSLPPPLSGTRPGPIAGIDFPGHLEDGDLPRLPKLNRSGRKPDVEASDVKVGIVGAGAAGLFTGMILDFLNCSLGDDVFHVSYDIWEAANKHRVGGRLYTYDFTAEGSTNPQGPHDYYDVGAMRFPDNKIMKRTFALFEKLGMHKRDLADKPPVGSLIPYYLQNMVDEETAGEFWCYNDINKWGDLGRITVQAADNDPFQINRQGDIPSRVIKHKPDDVMTHAIQPLRDALKADMETSPPGTKGWKLLMEYDYCSTRQFLSLPPPEPLTPPPIPPPPYNYDTIEWMETFNGGTNWYDQAHSETVLESLDFEYSDKTDWRCVLGGAQQLALRMENCLKSKPAYLSRVTAIRAEGNMDMEIDVERLVCGSENDKQTKKYAGVFNFTTLGCLKRIDTRKTSLNYATKQAVRSLGYGPSAKVGIKFKRAWWIHDLGKFSIKKGGLGHSDLTIRTCVYPSYNIYDSDKEPAVLLCSYTWQQDAERIGALMSTSSHHAHHAHQLKHEVELKELLLRDLARLHTYEGTTEEDIYNLISENYLDHYAHDWTHDPHTAGAFAFFRPQQFSHMWNKMIHPSGDLIIVGEAASPHHAWVVGALESAVHGVYTWLAMHEYEIKGATEALNLLETADEPDNPFVGLPPYMQTETARWSAFLGSIAREDYFEKIGKGGKEGKGLATRSK